MMAVSMQKRLSAALVEQIEAAEMTAVENGEWANTGHLLAMDGWDSVLDVHYQFASDRCTLRMTGPAVQAMVEAGTLEDSPPAYRVTTKALVRASGERLYELAWPALLYGEGDRIRGMLDLVSALLATAKAGS